MDSVQRTIYIGLIDYTCIFIYVLLHNEVMAPTCVECGGAFEVQQTRSLEALTSMAMTNI